MQQITDALGPPTCHGVVGDCEIALYHTDAADLIGKLPEQSVDLILTSPPYNISRAYAHYVDDVGDYDAWLRRMLSVLGPSLHAQGSLFLNVGYSRDNVPIAYKVWDASSHLSVHQEIIWSFSRGVACKHRYSPRHETLLWMSRDSPRFDLERVREPHDQSKCTCGTRNGRKRCNPRGKNPGDVWFVQTVAAGSGRAAKERCAHPAQMPLAVAERVVDGCGYAGGILLDPFCGSGTSLVAGVRRGMSVVGIDVDRAYIDMAFERLCA